jgi:hypothetical protein
MIDNVMRRYDARMIVVFLVQNSSIGLFDSFWGVEWRLDIKIVIGASRMGVLDDREILVFGEVAVM